MNQKHISFRTLRMSLLLLLGVTIVTVSPRLMASPMPQLTAQMNTGIQTTDPMQVQPEGSNPAWAPDIDPQMLAVIEQLMAFEAPPYTELTAAQAREVPGATDAVMAILRKTGTPPMPATVDIAHQVIPGSTSQGVLVRTYTPLEGKGPFPVIVYYHGGGWVIANLNTYEASAQALAEKTGAVVVSVAYRKAPEDQFPAAHEDSFAAYRWAVENASSIKGDPNRVAVAGESAGGNLAVAVALMARERDVQLPIHVLSVYPVADGDTESPSHQQYVDAMPLNSPLVEWFLDKYLGNPADANNPLISLVDADLRGLPPTTIINAEIDHVLYVGEELAQRMREANVPVEQKTFHGVTHEFFGMASILDQAVEAQDLAAMRLREAFESNE